MRLSMDQVKALPNTFKKGPTSRFCHEGRRFFTYTIYNKATDYPGKFVIRQWEVVPHQGLNPGIGFVCDTLFEARNLLPGQLYNTGRSEKDDPAILETWM